MQFLKKIPTPFFFLFLSSQLTCLSAWHFNKRRLEALNLNLMEKFLLSSIHKKSISAECVQF